VKIRTEKKSLEMRAILGKNLKEPPIYKKTRERYITKYNFVRPKCYIEN
jgi:hypothetical protein